ncbi:Meiosis inhibitor protein 1 [Liparis tanakae]|uniref:Meiosis inhibitor protein 1 n=1 Tax=Liparis tanakae TaxID=230148 RepID=A0A4Z2GZG8_9TELE|nr:Meiosis inhibitor protein 1 [Liparis tanakae]
MQEKGESNADERREQEPDEETTELLTLTEKYPAVILSLLDMVCTREATLAGRALAVLEVFIRGQRDYEADLCADLMPALLQAIQRLSVENMGPGLGKGPTAQVNSLPLVLKLLCVLQASGPPSSSTDSKMDGVHFKLLYHALLCCCHLLLSSLITLQRVHSAQVQKSLSWSLDTAVQRLLFQKRNTDNLLLVSYLRLLQSLLDADLASAVVRLSTGPGLVGSRPLGVEDGALYPLGSRGAQCLSTALSGLLLQVKHELLLRASVNCLSSLLRFLQRKSPATETYVACKPWSRFLVYCLLSSGESTRLHPATLRLITILLEHGSTSVLWEPDLLQVMETVETRGREGLGEEAALALRLLLSQILNSALHAQLTGEHERRVRRLIETLGPPAPSEGGSPSPPSSVLYPT